MASLAAQMGGLKLDEDPSLAAPMPPGKEGAACQIQTNLFGIRLNMEKNPIFRYDVTIRGSGRTDIESINDEGVVPLFFTRKSTIDTYTTERQSRCQEAMLIFQKRCPELFGDAKIFYDLQSSLFCTKKLNFQGNFFKELKMSETESCGVLSGMQIVALDMKACDENAQFTFDDIFTTETDIMGARADRTVLQFLDICLGAYPKAHPNRFLCFEKGKTFFKKPDDPNVDSREIRDLPDGKKLVCGSQKSLAYIEGPGGRGLLNIGLLVDGKKAAFHKAQSCAEKAYDATKFNFMTTCDASNLEKLNTVFRGLMIIPTHSKSQTAQKVIGVVGDAFKTITLKDKSGQETKCTIQQYYKDKYNVTLSAPNAPLLHVQSKRDTFYPIEVCSVVADQRVTVMQQTPEQSAQTTKECAVPPMRRQQLIMNSVAAQKISDEDNEYLKGAGFSVVDKPMRVDGRSMQRPLIVYGGNRPSPIDAERCSWRSNNFLAAASVRVWCVYQISRTGRPFVDLECLVQKLSEEAAKKGMKVTPCAEKGVAKESEMEGLFKYLQENGCEYLIVVMDDMVMAQDELKLYERKYEITTQNIKGRTAKEICTKGKGATVENLINKWNIKSCGINYSISVNNQRFLADCKTVIIGLGVSNPPPSSKVEARGGGIIAVPAVIGWAANVGQQVETFCGDFEIVAPRNEDAQMLGGTVADKVFAMWKQHSRPAPERVLIYRSGMASGSYEKMILAEIPAIRVALKNAGYDQAKITYVVVTKDHGVRLFRPQIDPNGRGPQQNIPSGTIVDQQLTHPKYKQFYLNSHVTLQGSASTPLYTMLVDENNYGMDEIERLSYDLAFNHQIVNLPTSLPTPMYVANRYADRGRRMFVMDQKKEGVSNDDIQDYKALNEKLCYGSSKFATCRINA